MHTYTHTQMHKPTNMPTHPRSLRHDASPRHTAYSEEEGVLRTMYLYVYVCLCICVWWRSDAGAVATAAHPSLHGNKRRQTVAQCRVRCRVINEFASLVCFTVVLEIFSAHRLQRAIFLLRYRFSTTFFLHVAPVCLCFCFFSAWFA